MERKLEFRAITDEGKIIIPDYIDRGGIAWWKENSLPKCTKRVVQFSGMFYHNGDKIFECDIVDIYESLEAATNKAGLLLYEDCQVVFRQGCFCFMVPADGPQPRVPIPIYFENSRKIVYKGNIFLNAELL